MMNRVPRPSSWARSVAVPSSQLFADPELRTRIARADVIFAINERDELRGILHGAAICREIGNGRYREFRPLEIVVLAVDGDSSSATARLLYLAVAAIKEGVTSERDRPRTDPTNLLFRDGAP